MFAKKLAEKLKGKGIRNFSIDPGGMEIPIRFTFDLISVLTCSSCPIWIAKTFHGRLPSTSGRNDEGWL